MEFDKKELNNKVENRIDTYDSEGLNSSLETLVKTVKDLTKVIDDATARIKQIEDTLNAANIKYEFTYSVLLDDEGDRNIDLACLSWKNHGSREESEYSIVLTTFAGEKCIDYNRLVCMKLEQRFKYIKHLNAFLHEFKEYIKQKQESLLFLTKD